MDLLDYYSRSDVLKALVKQSENREIQFWLGGVRGRRPEVVNFENDILEVIKKGMSSYHLSIERWYDPLRLKTGMNKRELDELRMGWDLLIDLDSKFFEYSRTAAILIIDALKFFDVKNYGLKFSGNNGFHIVIPYEAFPNEIDGINVKDHFPVGLKIIVEYLKSMIKDYLIVNLLASGSLEEIAKNIGKEKKDIVRNRVFDPFSVVDIDSVLISSRHLFRGCYSVNEKSGLVSVPVDDVKNFIRESAKIDNVKVNGDFFSKNVIPGEATKLLVQAFDWSKKQPRVFIEMKEKSISNNFIPLKDEVSEEFFPLCIKSLLNGVNEDGRKRTVFILIGFLSNMNWPSEKIKNSLLEWNKKNYEPLPENYIISQLSWAKRQEKRLPPNCENEIYYSNLKVKCVNCKFKNPVNYSLRLKGMLEKNKKRKIMK